jgi:benzoyl-CoA 2,3-dioxygenase component B
MGVKGRYLETRIEDDHVLTDATFDIDTADGGRIVRKTVPALSALNEVLRDDFIKDSVAGVQRWNKVLEKAGLPQRLTVPHKAFHRNIGALAGVKVSPDGRVLSEAEWQAHKDQWLPSAEDRAFVASLMGRVVEPGKFANWIAPPVMGINRQPIDFEYVRFA